MSDVTGVWYSAEVFPKESGLYVVALSKRINNFDVDEFNTNTNQWEFYSKEEMVKPKYWMKLPKIKGGLDE